MSTGSKWIFKDDLPAMPFEDAQQNALRLLDAYPGLTSVLMEEYRPAVPMDFVKEHLGAIVSMFGDKLDTFVWDDAYFATEDGGAEIVTSQIPKEVTRDLRKAIENYLLWGLDMSMANGVPTGKTYTVTREDFAL